MKDKYMAVAEQIARDNYQQEYYELPDNLQVQCYNMAMSMVHEYVAGWHKE
jgi:hypothetical protein